MKRVLAVLILGIAVIVGVLTLNIYVFVGTPSENSGQTIVVDRGMTLDRILQNLAAKGIITNIPLFKAYVFLERSSGKIRAGEYLFPPKVKPREVLSLLLKGDFSTRRITIPEGWTAKEIASHLGKLGLVNPDLFLLKCREDDFIRSLGMTVSNLEGYLYPDTYEIYQPKNEEEVLKRLVDRFREVYSTEFEEGARQKGLSQQEVVILASIVEKETSRTEERSIVASVFLNRLKKNIPLASDPTIIYSIADFNGNLTRANLNTPSPYNTYLKTGLPPTAISNPGRDALRAVLYPAETDYLYFVSKNDGTHFFSKTAEEHSAAVRKYQK